MSEREKLLQQLGQAALLCGKVEPGHLRRVRQALPHTPQWQEKAQAASFLLANLEGVLVRHGVWNGAPIKRAELTALWMRKVQSCAVAEKARRLREEVVSQKARLEEVAALQARFCEEVAKGDGALERAAIAMARAAARGEYDKEQARLERVKAAHQENTAVYQRLLEQEV